jgi:altronate hydrolase
MSAAISAVRLAAADTVLCLLRDHRAGERPVTADGAGPPLRQDTPLGHKIALRAIAAGEEVLKYGAPIGRATADIPAGAHVHLHNLRGFLEAGETP